MIQPSSDTINPEPLDTESSSLENSSLAGIRANGQMLFCSIEGVIFLLQLVLPLEKFQMNDSWDNFIHHVCNEVVLEAQTSWMLCSFGIQDRKR